MHGKQKRPVREPQWPQVVFLAQEPQIIEQAFEAINGPERFAPDPAEERWMAAIPQEPPDAFSR